MKGILADIHVSGPVKDLARAMQREPWAPFWNHLGLNLYQFDDVGLTPTSTDQEIWQRCQAEQLVFVTNNRNEDSPDSLESTLRQFSTPDSLPVFTIGDLDKFRISQGYAERVVERLYEYLLQIDDVRGTGRLFLP